MTRYFRKEVEKLKKQVLHVASMVEENLRAAVKAVSVRDYQLAQKVIERDVDIDQQEVELEEECLKILALHQPVAIDLRFIIAALKINNDLERIGDLAVNIAETTPVLAETTNKTMPFDLDGMLKLTMDMVKQSADSLIQMDPEMALKICRTDDEIDNQYRTACRAIETEVKNNPNDVAYFNGLRSIARNLERIADHATNISEDVIYMVDGRIVRHKGPNMIISSRRSDEIAGENH